MRRTPDTDKLTADKVRVAGRNTQRQHLNTSAPTRQHANTSQALAPPRRWHWPDAMAPPPATQALALARGDGTAGKASHGHCMRYVTQDEEDVDATLGGGEVTLANIQVTSNTHKMRVTTHACSRVARMVAGCTGAGNLWVLLRGDRRRFKSLANRSPKEPEHIKIIYIHIRSKSSKCVHVFVLWVVIVWFRNCDMRTALKCHTWRVRCPTRMNMIMWNQTICRRRGI